MSDNTPFFLDSDEAKSLGDFEYMQKSKRVRRTFPKTATNQVGELIKKVSATEDQKIDNNEYASTPTTTNVSVAKTKEETNKEVKKRRDEDTSINPFLEMARNINKRK